MDLSKPDTNGTRKKETVFLERCDALIVPRKRKPELSVEFLVAQLHGDVDSEMLPQESPLDQSSTSFQGSDDQPLKRLSLKRSYDEEDQEKRAKTCPATGPGFYVANNTNLYETTRREPEVSVEVERLTVVDPQLQINLSPQQLQQQSISILLEQLESRPSTPKPPPLVQQQQPLLPLLGQLQSRQPTPQPPPLVQQLSQQQSDCSSWLPENVPSEPQPGCSSWPAKYVPPQPRPVPPQPRQTSVLSLSSDSDDDVQVVPLTTPANKTYAPLSSDSVMECYANDGIPRVKLLAVVNQRSRRALSPLADVLELHPPRRVRQRRLCPNETPVLDAPVYRPTAREFANPLAYIESITTAAAPFGFCKIIPPAGFAPQLNLRDDLSFSTYCHFPHNMFFRFGNNSREMCAIRSGLKSQSRPRLQGLDIDLVNLSRIVQAKGGLEQVLKKKWFGRVADEMGYVGVPGAAAGLERAFMEYLLPYHNMTHRERVALQEWCDRAWASYQSDLVRNSRDPLARRRAFMRPEDDWLDDHDLAALAAPPAVLEADQCIISDADITVQRFNEVAAAAIDLYIGRGRSLSTAQLEEEYWNVVVLGTKLVSVLAGSIDTIANNVGFSTDNNDPSSTHPWNLKMLGMNSVLSSLGRVKGITAPSLHLGMIFSTNCWHQDPHGLPWIEYHHTGAPKIWYGVGESGSDRLRSAVEALCPAAVQNKPVWLPSNSKVSIPPRLLSQRGVSLSRLVQEPGEFVVVFPRAYSTAICTGYTVTETVCFGTQAWLTTARNDFLEVRLSCEGTMFALEQLLLGMVDDPGVDAALLPTLHHHLDSIISHELADWTMLINRGVQVEELPWPKRETSTSRTVNEIQTCIVCRSMLYLSMVRSLRSATYWWCPRHAVEAAESGGVTEAELRAAVLTLRFTEDQLHLAQARLRSRLAATLSTPETRPYKSQSSNTPPNR